MWRGRLLGIWRKHSHHYIWAFGLGPCDRYVLRLPDWEHGAAAGDENAGCPRRSDGLQVDLLLVDDVFVVESDILGVDARCDGGVKGVWRLGLGFWGRVDIYSHFMFLWTIVNILSFISLEMLEKSVLSKITTKKGRRIQR